MGLHSQRVDNPRRRREPLGHLKLSLEDLHRLVDEWEAHCESVTISIGDGVVADFVEDLADVSKSDLSNLVIHTVNPTYTISLRRNRAEVAYLGHGEGVLLSAIKYSLRPFRIKTPYYRLRVFWAWVYIIALMIVVFIDYQFHSAPPKPPALTPPPADAPPPPPPLFSTTLFIASLITLILLTAWFIYSYSKLDRQTSTRITTSSRRTLKGLDRRYNSETIEDVVIIDEDPIADE